MVDNVEQMKIALSSKMAILQVLGNLIGNPLLFTNKKYSIKVEDFPERFHKIVFGAIEYLASQGLQAISVLDIDQFLVQYTTQYKVFNENQGLVYVQKCIEAVDPAKFDYYYNVLKKSSLLGELYEQGFDIFEILDVTLVDPVQIAAQRESFDKMSLADILAKFDTKLITIQQKYTVDKRVVETTAGEGIMELIDSFSKTTQFGAPFNSPKLTTMLRGQQLGALHLDSSPSGGGKSRRAIGEAAHLSIPYYYDNYKNEWVHTGWKESVLYITTELKLYEVQGILLGYVSGVGQLDFEDNWNKNSLTAQQRVIQAGGYIRESNFHVIATSSLDIDDLTRIIRKYKQMYNVRYVYYDYLTPSLKMKACYTRKSGVKNVRDDEVLLDACVQLKELANELNIHIHTSSQMNRTGEREVNLEADNLRGAYSLVDLCDSSVITTRTRACDESVIQSYLEKGFTTRPNIVIKIIKLRKGKYNKIKLYARYDFGTSRIEDCFVTDEEGNFLNVEDTNMDIIIEQTEDKEMTKSKFEDFEF